MLAMIRKLELGLGVGMHMQIRASAWLEKEESYVYSPNSVKLRKIDGGALNLNLAKILTTSLESRVTNNKQQDFKIVSLNMPILQAIKVR